MAPALPTRALPVAAVIGAVLQFARLLRTGEAPDGFALRQPAAAARVSFADVRDNSVEYAEHVAVLPGAGVVR